MVIPIPMIVRAMSQPFDDPEWLYEIKHDGFRALTVIDDGRCRFYSKNRHRLTGFRDLAEAIVRDLHVNNAILDGEIGASDELGRTVFTALMQCTKPVRYFAFDLLWLNGRDLRSLPLQWRKTELKRLLPARSGDVLYVDHTKGAGTDLYRLACQLDLEGIVAKRADSPYGAIEMARDWITINNPHYSHQGRRGELFRKADVRRSAREHLGDY